MGYCPDAPDTGVRVFLELKICSAGKMKEQVKYGFAAGDLSFSTNKTTIWS